MANLVKHITPVVCRRLEDFERGNHGVNTVCIHEQSFGHLAETQS